MNERTQTRIAWVLSASMLTAGWLWRYLPGTNDGGASCADAEPRAVAVVVSPEAAAGGEGDRVYVYWLDQKSRPAGADASPGEDSATKEVDGGAPSSWKLAGATRLPKTAAKPNGAASRP
jgi:hypothetical protein